MDANVLRILSSCFAGREMKKADVCLLWIEMDDFLDDLSTMDS